MNLRSACLLLAMLPLSKGNLAIASEDTRIHVTIYNDGFASVKERRALELKKGESELRVTDMPMLLEPDSVVLRDLTDAAALHVLEQNYEARPLSADSMLAKAVGSTIAFEQVDQTTGARSVVNGKILRVGHAPRLSGSFNTYYQTQIGSLSSDFIVERDGKVGFGLPGQPLFDRIEPGRFLTATLFWKFSAASAGRHEVEISYLSGGFRWEATYNLFAESGDSYGLVGNATLENQTGKDFESTNVKLIAGEVHRVGPAWATRNVIQPQGFDDDADPTEIRPRPLDEYHLYPLPRPTTIRDGETKQVEFLRASHVRALRYYQYDGARPADGWFRQPYAESYGATSSRTVATVLEISNLQKNGLGLPLPRGTVKIYRPDIDGRNEFIGEDVIEHTTKGETIRINLGRAFDLVGSRTQVSFSAEPSNKTMDEAFSIRLRNHKSEDVEVRVIEHLWRGGNWKVLDESQGFRQLDASTIEFRVPIKADGEATVTYTAHYSL